MMGAVSTKSVSERIERSAEELASRRSRNGTGGPLGRLSLDELLPWVRSVLWLVLAAAICQNLRKFTYGAPSAGRRADLGRELAGG